ncbi:hypothetical protein [Streptomyces sp. YIM S03343]
MLLQPPAGACFGGGFPNRQRFSIDYEHSIDWMSVDTVLLDEILPNEDGGCLHEIALTDASITVRCEDLQAVWEDAD